MDNTTEPMEMEYIPERFLIYDTETSGMPAFDCTDWSNARLIQLSWIVVEEEDVLKECNYLINDRTVMSNAESLSVHHIEDNYRYEHGYDATEVLNEFIDDASKVDVMVCHSGTFDIGVIRNECILRNVDMSPFLYTRIFNTKQSEVYKALYPTTLSNCIAKADPEYKPPGNMGPHDALYDTYLCWRLLQLTYDNYNPRLTVYNQIIYLNDVIAGLKQVKLT